MGKICLRCNITKEREFFPKREGESFCKQCKNELHKEWKRTKEGHATKLFYNQCYNSKRRNHPKPTYSKQEFIEWLFSNDDFHTMYDNWVDSGFKKDNSPSIDRADPSLGYSFENIQLMTWHDNNIKGRSEQYHGKKKRMSVNKLSLDGEVLDTFPSMAEAGRVSQVDRKSIKHVCGGVLGTAGGFRWEFAESA